MTLRDYILAVVTRIEEAGTKGDREEAIRLLRLLRDVAEGEAVKLERPSGGNGQTG